MQQLASYGVASPPPKRQSILGGGGWECDVTVTSQPPVPLLPKYPGNRAGVCTGLQLQGAWLELQETSWITTGW